VFDEGADDVIVKPMYATFSPRHCAGETTVERRIYWAKPDMRKALKTFFHQIHDVILSMEITPEMQNARPFQ